MNIFKKRRGYWPLGEQYAGFFRGSTILSERVIVKIRNSRDVRPFGFTPLMYDFTGHEAHVMSRAIQPLPFKPPSEELFETLAWAKQEFAKLGKALADNRSLARDLEAHVVSWVDHD